MHAPVQIVPVSVEELDRFLVYLEDHLSDNGLGAEPLFLPLSRTRPWSRAEKASKFQESIARPLGEPGWRRTWMATTAEGAILGHVDLRARPEPAAAHRALLGAGVSRDARRRGIGSLLVRHVVAWATTETRLEWIDLNVLCGNAPAHKLYETLGFTLVSSVEDMFRIDGERVGDIAMTLKVPRRSN